MVTRFSRGQTLTLTVGLGPGQINPRETESECSVVKEPKWWQNNSFQDLAFLAKLLAGFEYLKNAS